MAPAEAKTSGKEQTLSDVVDMPTFEQILEMDEPGDNEFSMSIVFGFFDQAEETFATMDKQLLEGNLKELSDLGHFLKGSSATLGLVKVRDGCEHIQRYGKQENTDGSPLPDEEKCLYLIGQTLAQVKKDFEDASTVLRKYYDEKSNEA